MSNSVFVIPDPEDFLKVMEDLQKAYDEKYNEDDDGESE